MTRIDYDTEFLEDGHTISLISIGMVREDGQEYYAVNADAPWRRIREHDWLRENVLPSLPPILPSSPLVRARHVIASQVRDFILAAPDPQLWAWYAAYDHVALCQLWGPMVNLPKGIPMWTNDLKQEAVRLGNPEVPRQEHGVHNALEDARHNRVIAQFLREHEAAPPS